MGKASWIESVTIRVLIDQVKLFINDSDLQLLLLAVGLGFVGFTCVKAFRKRERLRVRDVSMIAMIFVPVFTVGAFALYSVIPGNHSIFFFRYFICVYPFAGVVIASGAVFLIKFFSPKPIVNVAVLACILFFFAFATIHTYDKPEQYPAANREAAQYLLANYDLTDPDVAIFYTEIEIDAVKGFYYFYLAEQTEYKPIYIASGQLVPEDPVWKERTLKRAIQEKKKRIYVVDPSGFFSKGDRKMLKEHYKAIDQIDEYMIMIYERKD